MIMQGNASRTQYRINVSASQFPYSGHLAHELFDALQGMGVQKLSMAYVANYATPVARYGFSFFGEGGGFQVELMKQGDIVELSVQIDGAVQGVSPEIVKATLEAVIAQHTEPEKAISLFPGQLYGMCNGGIKFAHDWPVWTALSERR